MRPVYPVPQLAEQGHQALSDTERADVVATVGDGLVTADASGGGGEGGGGGGGGGESDLRSGKGGKGGGGW